MAAKRAGIFGSAAEQPAASQAHDESGRLIGR
jgi:hypothetical protein